MARADVIVIGAGIVGAACAAELAARGLDVEVLDAGGIGGGATAAGMGHLVVMNDTPAELALSRRSLARWRALAPQLRQCDAYLRCGTLWVAADDEELEAARAMRDGYAAAGVSAEVLDAAALGAREPMLAAGLAGGLLVDGDGIVYAPSAAEWLLRHSPGAARIRLRLRCAAVALDGTTVRLAGGETLDAAQVVVANGLAAARLVDGVALQPKKGHLLITDRYPGAITHQLLELGYIKSAHHAQGTSVAFNAQPRPTGQILIGSSRQFGTTDPAVEMPVLARMLARAQQYLPGLADLSALRAWTGFRAATPDGLPLIGPVAERPGVWLATGHEGLGVTTSLATAELIAAQLAGGEPPIPPEPYSPSRPLAGAAHA
ncbi:NAD(P)/FAD-dependent oxidoreductase [Burkholderia glumae]|uniref:FAD-binding oxidoreductase n=1 Tax=Burkholderia glumae TaxID=337 RepID=A0AAP9XZ37_BURGL|nr:FAD-dependent oxidoreductase [Burkholderia glumae]ACR30838.1 Putative oxidoreductase [Burkholderia glumae BGR1]AJY64642.1 FAD dependent oxidoreductase family protein [Burkholderia glumae LMG 2196 = ATCC 33617]KHJ62234.1 D-amino acid oxidase [Burkholderia glumae]MCM2483851.1 FAD-binding oxidoreductase [Burkholderia glumae]MCM2509545.1 FAD-binding oxidoreductase [Burkholderia glumae]